MQKAPNFLGFRVWADGDEVTPEVEIRATLPDGRDIGPQVQQIGGLPLVLPVDDKDAVVASGNEDIAKAFCLDQEERRTLQRMSDQARMRRLKQSPGPDPYLSAYTLGYVLQMARNWRGPIGTFHLAVIGGPIPLVGSTETYTPGAVAFCSQVPIKQTQARGWKVRPRTSFPVRPCESCSLQNSRLA